MNPSLLLTAWIAFPLLFWVVTFSSGRRFGPVGVGLLCCTAMIAGVVLLANHVWAIDAHLLAEIDKYELGSPERDHASRAWSSDVNRSMTLLLSPLLTAIWYSAVFLMLFGIRRVVRKVSRIETDVKASPREESPQNNSGPADEGSRT